MTLSPDLLAELKKSITGSLRTDLASRILYSTDASIYQIEPLGVVIPRDQDDLQAVVELAAKYKTPILPRGSGSSLAGQAVGEALIVDVSRWLDHIIEVDPEARTATVEPGVILAALNKAAAKHGLQFGPDPASAERATLGGVIGNNATGAHSILYGMAADHILAADVVMADGSLATWKAFDIEEVKRKKREDNRLSSFLLTCLDLREQYAVAIQQHYPTTWRNSAGYRLNYLLPWSPSVPSQWTEDRGRWTVYDTVHGPSSIASPLGTVNLAPLLAGSEGTLAVIRRATLNLVPKPKHTILAVLNYDSHAAACDDVPHLLEHRPSAIELISRNIVRLAMAVPAYAAQAQILAGDSEALLVVEFSGDQPEALKERALALRPDVLAESAQDQSRIWNIRKMGLGILASHTGDAKTVAFIEDCAIPVERLGGFVRGVQHILDEFHTQAEFYAHASAGCLHIRPILDLKTQVRELRGISEAVLALTISLGGSMSSEHGDGLSHSEWLGNIYGDEVLNAFRTLKLAADPERILNPGKLIDAPRMDSNLRYGLGYRTKVWPTPLDFSHQDGLANAIEQCNGQGVCRKFDGVMCPSFQATREEQNATRGRANLLRAMISGRWTVGGRPSTVHRLQSEVFASLDLCLACKGCKAECPSGVDMAKLKFAFMDEYYKSHPRQLRDYLFGYFHTVSALMSPIAPLANALMGFDPTRKLIAKITGITTERPFPKYSTKRAHVGRVADSTRRILFLSDAFTRYIEPQVEQAAFDVLSQLGVDVQVIPVVGAGASLLSKGFIDAARHHAERVLTAIQHLDPNGETAIVGLEPPDLYCLKHDYRDLLPAHAQELSAITQRTWLLEEWLLRLPEFKDLRVGKLGKENEIGNQVNNKSQKLIFHPHCHQRAESAADDGQPTGPAATMAVLRHCGYEVELSDAGCCGMAGTFGYESEHYDLSMKAGELKLLPSIRPLLPPPHAQADGGLSTKMTVANLGEVVSTGSACRLQIEQGAKVNTTHPIVLVARALKAGGT